jgi:hypothetical protein
MGTGLGAGGGGFLESAPCKKAKCAIGLVKGPCQNVTRSVVQTRLIFVKKMCFIHISQYDFFLLHFFVLAILTPVRQ